MGGRGARKRGRGRGGHAAAEGPEEEPVEEPRGDAGPEPVPAGRARQRDEGAEVEEAQVREAGQGAAGGVDGVLQRGAPRGRRVGDQRAEDVHQRREPCAVRVLAHTDKKT